MTCNLRTVNSSLRNVNNFTVRTNCTDRKEIAPLSNFTSKTENGLSVANNMQFTDRKNIPYGPYELYGPNAKFTDRYSAGILDNPQTTSETKCCIYFTIFNFTVSGNANFRMTQTTFTMVGFTQPQAALPIIEDIQNNAKGFTSRILWIFPEPVFCRMKDSWLTPEESERVNEFQEQLGM